MLTTFLALAAAVATPPPGWTTTGLSDTRKPWQFDWQEPDADWLYVGDDAQKGHWFIQLSSSIALSRQPRTRRKFWVKLDLSKVPTEKARNAKALYLMNCEAETYEVPMMIWYMADGGLSGPQRSYPSQPLIPESVAAHMAKNVCAQ